MEPTTVSQIKQAVLKLLVVLGVTLALFSIGSVVYREGKNKAYEECSNYYYKTEALLDSISAWDNTFYDRVMQTDVYYEYELAYLVVTETLDIKEDNKSKEE